MNATWHTALGSMIHSEAWLNVISHALDYVLSLLYMAYAVIGFGLWKLKNWARRSLLGIAKFGVVAALVVSFVFVRHIAFGVALVGMGSSNLAG
jgi:hypothetical protein